MLAPTAFWIPRLINGLARNKHLTSNRNYCIIIMLMRGSAEVSTLDSLSKDHGANPCCASSPIWATPLLQVVKNEVARE